VEITITNIKWTDPEYKQVWQLREDVLRIPLGLSLKNEDLSRDEFNTIFIAKNNADVIGCVFMQPINSDEIQLRAMAVYPDWQGKGIGRMLVKDAELFAQKEGYKKIILHARKVALEFYLSMEYVVTSDQFTEVGIPHFMMEKKF